MRKSFLVPEIKPLDQYDFSRARSAASLAWVLAKGYGGAGLKLRSCEDLQIGFASIYWGYKGLKNKQQRSADGDESSCSSCIKTLRPLLPEVVTAGNVTLFRE
uniref:Uncharacterized protein n=1 Tax=Sphaerodactylus townsendi TaxID=933632 RepID=A0ACB8EK06_9SAUR